MPSKLPYGLWLACIRGHPNILFRLADCEHPLPPPPSGADALRISGKTNALRALLKAEQDRGPDFFRLANALSALYPKGSEEKRLLDAMLLAVPR